MSLPDPHLDTTSPHYLHDMGVTYRHIGDGQPRIVESVFEYEWLHAPTGIRGKARLAVVGDDHETVQLLIRHWNRTPDWWYRLI